MRRAVIVITATVAGTTGVLTYHPGLGGHPGTKSSASAGGTTAGSGQGRSGTTTVTSGSGGSSDGWVTGSAVDMPYGTVQVKVLYTGGKISDVQTVQLPTDGHSQFLSQQAAAVLHDEVVQAQSANVDMVSGATFTSTAYLQSLQSALDAHHG